jgi:CRP-like cAMP-binding protein
MSRGGLVILDSAIFFERFPWLAEVARNAPALQGMLSRRFGPGEKLLDCGEISPGAYLMRSGFACRYNVFPNGQRQIIGLVLPGDLCDSRATMYEHVDYSVSALDTVDAILIPASALVDRENGSVSLLRAICCLAAIEDAMDRRWLLNVGYLTALERVAHLLCEIFTRLQIVGLTRHTVCDLPLSQTDIADATALTPVHVNRMLMELRRRGIISLKRRELTIHDFKALQTLGGFSADYLLSRKSDLRMPGEWDPPSKVSRVSASANA